MELLNVKVVPQKSHSLAILTEGMYLGETYFLRLIEVKSLHKKVRINGPLF